MIHNIRAFVSLDLKKERKEKNRKEERKNMLIDYIDQSDIKRIHAFL